jgi:CRP/FNR family cyclic AMP-dependent transcriptional regulator
VPSAQKQDSDAADLLAALPAPLRDLAAQGAVRHYRANTTLIEEADRGDTLFIVLSGSLRIFCSDPNGREITLAIYGPGEYVGEMSLDGGPRSASVCTETASVCAVVGGQSLRQHLATNPEFTLELIQRLIRRTRLATENARSLALLDAYGRLARLFAGRICRARSAALHAVAETAGEVVTVHRLRGRKAPGRTALRMR